MKFVGKNYFAIILCIVSVTVGFSAGYITKPSEIVSSNPIRENTDKYKFIHPLLAVNRLVDDPSPQFANLSKNIEDFIAKKQNTSSLETASVYFISYDKGNGSFAINQNEKYAPASLLKVVIMMAYLKKSETIPDFFSQKMIYKTDLEKKLESIPFETPTKLKNGERYTVEQLINNMIIDSDNGAKSLLLLNIEDEYLNQVYLDLNLKGPTENDDYTISVKDYALFLRVLFNSTYLSDKNSEKALSILSKATFSEGIVAGVPKDVDVAHKFGQHINSKGEAIDSLELHDCGVVYAKPSPYLLCVMTRGKDLNGLKETISGISKIVYSNVAKQ